ncbi:MAG: MucR family transcriptional regulator [Bosea sp. (in: a-proteobacteria)]
MSEQSEELVAVTASIVSAYVTRNNVPTTDLPRLIESTHATLAGLAGRPAAAAPRPQVPAVPIGKSVTPDGIICLEDGRAFKSLKRHLSARYGLTPDQYRAKWNLPADYPMVAPNYAEARSALAKSMRLGRKGLAAARRRAKS